MGQPAWHSLFVVHVAGHMPGFGGGGFGPHPPGVVHPDELAHTPLAPQSLLAH